MSILDFDRLWRQTTVERTRGGYPHHQHGARGRVVDYEEYGVDSGQGGE